MHATRPALVYFSQSSGNIWYFHHKADIDCRTKTDALLWLRNRPVRDEAGDETSDGSEIIIVCERGGFRPGNDVRGRSFGQRGRNKVDLAGCLHPRPRHVAKPDISPHALRAMEACSKATATAPELAGTSFMKRWGDQPIATLFCICIDANAGRPTRQSRGTRIRRRHSLHPANQWLRGRSARVIGRRTNPRKYHSRKEAMTGWCAKSAIYYLPGLSVTNPRRRRSISASISLSSSGLTGRSGNHLARIEAWHQIRWLLDAPLSRGMTCIRSTYKSGSPKDQFQLCFAPLIASSIRSASGGKGSIDQQSRTEKENRRKCRPTLRPNRGGVSVRRDRLCLHQGSWALDISRYDGAARPVG